MTDAEPGTSQWATFGDPPIVEVALSVSCQPLDLDVTRVSELWVTSYQQDYPSVQEQPPYQMPVEPADGSVGSLVSFQLAPMPLAPRLWFLDGSGRRLLQVQRDWFAVNWRKLGGDEAYPRYSGLRDEFARRLAQYIDFAAVKDAGAFKPTQVELTYINHIPLAVPGQPPMAAPDILRVMCASPSTGLPEPESSRVGLDYVIESGDVRYGRLHIAVNPAIRRFDQMPILDLTITARGRPLGDGVDGVLGFLDLGHDWAHRAFQGVTTEAIQERWRRL